MVTPTLNYTADSGLPIIAGVPGVQEELEKMLLSQGAGGSIEQLSLR